MNSPQPAPEGEEDFPQACRRVAAALRRNARAAPDVAAQRFALARADELEKSATRHERIAVGLAAVEAAVAEADRLRALAMEMVEAAQKQFRALQTEALDTEKATKQ